MKNKTFLTSILVLSLGILMLIGTSYSLITNNSITNETYGFNVANFDTQFLDNTKISISGIPINDEDALNKGKEYSFTVNNNSQNDVNYRLDIIENSTFSMSNVIRYAYSINNSDYGDIYTLSDNTTLNQNRTLRVGEKDIYKLKIWLAIDADEEYMNKKFSASINLFATFNENKYATSVIEYLFNNHLDNVISVDNNEYRYAGIEPSNYVWFNCKGNYSKGEDYCEKWRIIGSFDNNEYKSLKITSNKVYSKISFNNKELTGLYNNSYVFTYANGYFYDLLNNHAKNLIMESKYYIGNSKGENLNMTLYEEKNNFVYANIGLFNVSDYLALKDDSWLIKDNVMTMNKDDNKINVINNTLTKEDINSELSFVPVVYLKSDVSIVSGDGTYNNPYQLEIRYPINYIKVK